MSKEEKLQVRKEEELKISSLRKEIRKLLARGEVSEANALTKEIIKLRGGSGVGNK